MRHEDHAQPDARSSTDARGAFLITIDTEGDDLWSKPRDITVRNVETLPRFQELCEKYGLRPTYLANWEMATSPSFLDFGRDVLERDAAEIGMHLHAWNSPPLVPLTDDDFGFQPFLMEYPEGLIREKVTMMTDTLESTFGVKIVSHRAGRWGLSETYVKALIDAGYRVDCSVTPHVDWRGNTGDPAGGGGSDYRHFPETPYFMDPADISRPGDSSLLQVPMTIVRRYDSALARRLRACVRPIPFVRRYFFRALPAHSWLRPTASNGAELRRVLSIAQGERRDYVEFMLHSSELMPGGSPMFPSPRHVDALYGDLEALFDSAGSHWAGHTLSEYRDRFQPIARSASGLA